MVGVDGESLDFLFLWSTPAHAQGKAVDCCRVSNWLALSLSLFPFLRKGRTEGSQLYTRAVVVLVGCQSQRLLLHTEEERRVSAPADGTL